jgi:ABC-type transporter Mla MlaB component
MPGHNISFGIPVAQDIGEVKNKGNNEMLRISEIELIGDAATLRLEGRAVGTLVTEVKNACEKHLSAGHRLRLDLADLSFVDRAAVALLQELRLRGVALMNCSPFLKEELKQAVLRDAVNR